MESDVYYEPTVCSCYPEIVRKESADSWNAFEIEFIIPIEQYETEECMNIFEAETIDLLGNSASCETIDEIIYVSFGENALFDPYEDEIQIKSDKIHYPDSPCITSDYALKLDNVTPDDFFMPSFQIEEEFSISSEKIQTMTLTEIQSGHDLFEYYQITWSLKSISFEDEDHFNTIEGLCDGFNEQESVQFESRTFSHDAIYTFTISVSNFLHVSKTHDVTLNVFDKIIIQIPENGDLNYAALNPHEDLILTAIVENDHVIEGIVHLLWESEEINMYDRRLITTPITDNYIRINSTGLTMLDEYEVNHEFTVKIKYSDDVTEEIEDSITFSYNSFPQQGNIEVNTVSGNAMTDSFIISANNW